MTANTWYCEVLHTEFGPLTWDDLRGMATRGTLRAQDRVRQQGSGWRVASEIEGLFVSPPADDATDFEITIPPPASAAADDEFDFDLSG
ncbi:MAG TPA: DUF4339 domain-containing protein [Pirellulales bacterium]|jgi:hypothetical protein|nr:DUF4339 domain-containing protein [Pirellulales bacterium]